MQFNQIIKTNNLGEEEKISKLIFSLGALSVATAPFWFLKLFNINLVLFDILIFILGFFLVYHYSVIKFKPILFYLISGLFIFAAILAIINSSSPFKAATGALQYFFIFYFLFPILYTLLSYDIYKKYIRILCRVWIFFLLFNFLFLFNPSMYYAERFQSFYGSPVGFGMITAIMLPFIINGLYIEKKTPWKIIIWLGILIDIFFLLISGSRAATIAAIIGTSIFLILIRKLSFKIIKKIIFFVFLLSIILVFSLPQFSRNVFSRSFLEENIASRLQQYIISYHLYPDVFFIGSGLHTSSELVMQYGGTSRPHNLFICLFLETGIFGFIAIVGILWFSLGWGIKLIFASLLKNIKVNSLIAATFSSGLILFLAMQASTASVHRGLWIFFVFSLWAGQQKKFYFETNEKNNRDSNERKV